MLKDYQKKLLELLEQLEREIAVLYKLFAGMFPAHESLWSKLREEEEKHASYLNKLTALAEQDKIRFNERMTKTYTVQAVINDVKLKQQKAQKGDFSLVNALAFSLSLEQSIIEHKFYDYFTSGDAGIVTMLNAIKEETANHALSVQKALTEAKRA
ncbi:MAG TPA: hypothetical protein P5040_00680 [Smithella sp.]|nr:hypothetical protein [Smithella sp.]HRS96668.1 hypothetical protein [Smithella sp.]